jgi:hypothetical protein
MDHQQLDYGVKDIKQQKNDSKLPTVLPEFHKFRLQDENTNTITFRWEHYMLRDYNKTF